MENGGGRGGGGGGRGGPWASPTIGANSTSELTGIHGDSIARLPRRSRAVEICCEKIRRGRCNGSPHDPLGPNPIWNTGRDRPEITGKQGIMSKQLLVNNRLTNDNHDYDYYYYDDVDDDDDDVDDDDDEEEPSIEGRNLRELFSRSRVEGTAAAEVVSSNISNISS
ncbi:hypothetical protein HZH68_016505 [Vespula germanica]|uniref:Uncharacterized protein n=1 Tax=Vespula germanica TaxID=30212 RepID=A0A834MPT5_VESGE|nr:hypothetical protein HZH68_016505 [Vespula germanica]